MKKLSELDCAPEEFENERLLSIPDEIAIHSEMHQVERQFINGLVRQLRPRRILELGVAEGMGSVVLLNAIGDRPDAKLYSVDVLKNIWNAPDLEVGFVCEKMYPESNSQWLLLTGKDFSEHSDIFVEPFDFCVIDTAHIHPVESLNFLTVLPFLTNDAVVVFHDLALFTLKKEYITGFPNSPFANILCFNSIVGDKLKPNDEAYLAYNYGFASLGAVQVCADTMKYIQNVFDMLYFPWASYIYHLSPYIKSVAEIIKKYYSPQLYDHFSRATIANAMFIENGYEYAIGNENDSFTVDAINSSKALVFYGAGNMCQRLLGLFERNAIRFPDVVLDINASNIEVINGIPVVEPSLESNPAKYNDSIIVITILDEITTNSIKAEILRYNPTACVYTMPEVRKAVAYREVKSLRVL